MTHTNIQKYCSWVQDQIQNETNFDNTAFTPTSERPEPQKMKINPDYVLGLMERRNYTEDNLLWKFEKCVNNRFDKTEIEIDNSMNVEYSFKFDSNCYENHQLLYDEKKQEYYCPVCDR